MAKKKVYLEGLEKFNRVSKPTNVILNILFFFLAFICVCLLYTSERQVWQRLGEKRARALLESTALFNQCFRENGTDAHS